MTDPDNPGRAPSGCDPPADNDADRLDFNPYSKPFPSHPVPLALLQTTLTDGLGAGSLVVAGSVGDHACRGLRYNGVSSRTKANCPGPRASVTLDRNRGRRDYVTEDIARLETRHPGAASRAPQGERLRETAES